MNFDAEGRPREAEPGAGGTDRAEASGPAATNRPRKRRSAARGTEAPRALVTGGAVRVGRAIALALGRAGYSVALHYHASAEAAESAAAAIRDEAVRAGPRDEAEDADRAEPADRTEPAMALPLQADLSKPEEVRRLFQRIEDAWGRLDLLVNNAAVFPRARPGEVRVADWDHVFAVNLRAPFLCAREAARLMGEAGGAIVNIADVAAFEAWPAYAPYAASKAGLVSLTRSLARAWAPRVRVNAVAPGAVLLPEGTDQEARRAAAGRAALGRVGRPEDVARAVLYLAEAEYVTGDVLRVDGGAHLLRGTSEP